MRHKIFIIIALFISFLCFFDNYLYAQETAPTYLSLMKSGDKEFAKKEYIKAKTYYQEALRLKNNDPVAKNKLNTTLQKIRERNKQEEIFFQYIDDADNHYNNGELNKALTLYNNALKIFPKDSYALEQVKIITKIINDEKEKLDSFNQMVEIGDRLLSQKKYAEASLQYESALQLYPNHKPTQEKYEQAKSLKKEYDRQTSYFEHLKQEASEFALRKKYVEAIKKYQEALKIFPDDTEVKDEINALTTKKLIAEQYDVKINEADSLYLEKSYEMAKTSYNEALKIIPDDSYSSDMIKHINEIINSDEYLALQNYLNIIEEAKQLEKNNYWEDALEKYKTALKTKPNDEFATQKIDYLTQLIENKNHEIKINTQYQALIDKGDNAQNHEDFQSALTFYTQACELIPDRPEAKDKKAKVQKIIQEIEIQLALEHQKCEEYYHDAMSSAQQFMDSQDYVEAIKKYNIALRYKPDDELATQGLNSATQLNEARLAALSKEYDQYVSNGDIQFESKNYDKAIDFYSKAMALNTGNPYPSDMINRIGKILQENKLEELVETPVQIMSNKTKRFSFKPINVTHRRNNYLLIKAKNLSESSFMLYISYGSSIGKNGGFMVQVPNNKNLNDFIVRIGSQYKWFSEDNTWIEFSPENGSLEIELMEITKGD